MPRTTTKTQFGFESTAAEVIQGIDLTGKRAVVTGGSSGIGVETARALASAGAEITLAVRDLEAGARTAAAITGSTGNDAVLVEQLDLADPGSAAAFGERWDGPLHLLVNNAGVMAIAERTLSSRGWEMQLATNHVGHFALALGLHDALAEANGARIVSLSSRGHLRSPVLFDDLDFSDHPYDPWTAYGQSKTANILFAVEASRRWGDEKILANAVHPGAIAETNLSRHMGAKEFEAAIARAGAIKSTEQGAATSVLVATSPLVAGVGGRYFEDCNEAPVLPQHDATATTGVAAYALDPANAERLWDVSLELLG